MNSFPYFGLRTLQSLFNLRQNWLTFLGNYDVLDAQASYLLYQSSESWKQNLPLFSKEIGNYKYVFDMAKNEAIKRQSSLSYEINHTGITCSFFHASCKIRAFSVL